MIEFTIPGSAPSTPNLREHHFARARRVKSQRAAVARKMPVWTEGPLLVVRLTRVGPRALDGDNLAAALKGHRDAVAARLRVDDATPLVRWEYHQAKGEPAVVVQVWRGGDWAPEHIRDFITAKAKAGGRRQRCGKNGCRNLRPCVDHDGTMKREAVANYTPPLVQRIGMGSDLRDQEERRCEQCSKVIPEWRMGLCSACDNHYTPPRSKPVDAAREAEVFAPGPPTCRMCGCQIRAMDAGMCNTCLEDQRIMGRP